MYYFTKGTIINHLQHYKHTINISIKRSVNPKTSLVTTFHKPNAFFVITLENSAQQHSYEFTPIKSNLCNTTLLTLLTCAHRVGVWWHARGPTRAEMQLFGQCGLDLKYE